MVLIARNLVGAEHRLFGVVRPQEFDREFFPDWDGEGAQDRADYADARMISGKRSTSSCGTDRVLPG